MSDIIAKYLLPEEMIWRDYCNKKYDNAILWRMKKAILWLMIMM